MEEILKKHCDYLKLPSKIILYIKDMILLQPPSDKSDLFSLIGDFLSTGPGVLLSDKQLVNICDNI